MFIYYVKTRCEQFKDSNFDVMLVHIGGPRW